MKKRTYKVRITKDNIALLKKELKEDESLESSVRAPKPAGNPPLREIRVTVKIISQNKADLIEQTIKANDGAILGAPDDRGEYEEHPSKFCAIKSNMFTLIISWVALFTMGLFGSLYELNNLVGVDDDVFVFLVIMVSSIIGAFGLTFNKKILAFLP